MDAVFGVRKGTWTEEEDELLCRCIEKYGEGKWRHVPLRAGLRRCRKSCRLRWLNYLSPNIKRGEFTYDEVDLIFRLHKLLGNRCSLIAGRLPGRTANDIKNYWNIRFTRKTTSITASKAKEVEARSPVSKKNEIIKPRPWTFHRDSPWLLERLSTSTSPDLPAANEDLREMMGMTTPSHLQGSTGQELESNTSNKELGKGKSGYVSECVEDFQQMTQVRNDASLEEDSIGWNDDFFLDFNFKSRYVSECVEDFQQMTQVRNDASLEEDSIGWNDDFFLDFNFWDTQGTEELFS